MTLTITTVIRIDDEMDDAMAILEQQISEALGFIGEVQTCDVSVDEDFIPPTSPDSTGYSNEDDLEPSLDEQLTTLFESDLDDIEWQEETEQAVKEYVGRKRVED